MSNFNRRAHRRFQRSERNPVHIAYFKETGAQIGIIANYNAIGGAIQFNHVKRLSRRNAQSLALPYSVIVNAAVAADDFAARGDEVAFFLWQRFATLAQVGGDELDVVPRRHEANFLALRLFRYWEGGPARNLAYRNLVELAEWEIR